MDDADEEALKSLRALDRPLGDHALNELLEPRPVRAAWAEELARRGSPVGELMRTQLSLGERLAPAERAARVARLYRLALDLAREHPDLRDRSIEVVDHDPLGAPRDARGANGWRFDGGRLVRGPVSVTAKELVDGLANELRAEVPVPPLRVHGLVRFEEWLDARFGHLDASSLHSFEQLHRGWIEEQYGLEDRVTALAESEALRGFADLELQLNLVAAPGAQTLLSSPALDSVERLTLVASHLPGDAFTPLARSPMRNTLRRLELERPDDQDATPVLGDALLARLDEGGYERLEALRLPRVPVSVDGLARFLDGRSALHTLELEESMLGDEGLGALAGCPALSRIRELDLSFPLGYDEDGELAQGGAGLRRFLRSAHLNVERLDIGTCPGALEALLDAPASSRLEQLAIDVSPSGLEALVNGDLPRLRSLTVHRDPYDELDPTGLREARFLGRLERLSLDVDDSWTPRELLTTPAVGALRTLRAPANVESVSAVVQSVHLRSLNTLILPIERAQMSQGAVAFDPDAFVDVLLGSRLPLLAHLVLEGRLAAPLMERLRSRYWVTVR